MDKEYLMEKIKEEIQRAEKNRDAWAYEVDRKKEQLEKLQNGETILS